MDDKYTEMAERIAVLEEKAHRDERDRDEIKLALQQIRTSLANEAAIMHSLLNKVSKWEGSFGGIVFVMGCLWMFFSGVGKALVNYVTLTGGIGK